MNMLGSYFVAAYRRAIKKLTPRKRIELRYLTWAEADDLIKADPRWRIAQEEDDNATIGMVYLELMEAD